MEPIERLRALALIRAAITQDQAAANAILAKPATDELARQLATLTAGLADIVMGEDAALAMLDRFSEAVILQDDQ